MVNSTANAILPANFFPGEHHILIARGRVAKMHSGNRKFDKMISDIAGEYAAAPCKATKGLILTKLINQIHDAAPDAGFVRKDPSTGRWTLAEEALARQTAAQALRNALSSFYRSSKQFKSKRRFQRISQDQVDTYNQKSCTSSLEVDGKIPSVTESLFYESLHTRCVSPSESIGCGPMDTLDVLLDSFLPVTLTGNPFEPTPLAPSLDWDSADFDFDPIPF